MSRKRHQHQVERSITEHVILSAPDHTGGRTVKVTTIIHGKGTRHVVQPLFLSRHKRR